MKEQKRTSDLPLYLLAGAIGVAAVSCAIVGISVDIAAHLSGLPAPSGTVFTVGAKVIAHQFDLASVGPSTTGRPISSAWLWFSMTVLALVPATTAVFLRRRLRRHHERSVRTSDGFATRTAVVETVGRRAAHYRDNKPDPNDGAKTLLGLDLGTDRLSKERMVARAEDSVIVASSSRGGKTSTFVIPNVFLWKGSGIVTSTRPELYNLTAGAHSSVGLFDPTGFVPDATTLQWNPIASSTAPLQAILRARSFIFGSGTGKGVSGGEYFGGRSATLLRCMFHAAAVAGLNIDTVIQWLCDPDNRDPLDILAASQIAPLWSSDLRGIQKTPIRERASTYNGALLALDAFADPRVLDACCPPKGQSFDMEAAINAGTMVYLCADNQTNQAIGSVIAAFAEAWVNTARTMAVSHGGRLTLPTALFLDEAAQIAPLPTLPEIVSDGGGSGIMSVVVLQSMDHARARWGVLGAEKMWNASSVKVILGGGTDPNELEDISRLCGEIDVDAKSETHGIGGAAHTRTRQRRRVIEPAAIRALPEGEALVLYRRLAPVQTLLRPWWDRKMGKRIKALQNAETGETA